MKNHKVLFDNGRLTVGVYTTDPYPVNDVNPSVGAKWARKGADVPGIFNAIVGRFAVLVVWGVPNPTLQLVK